MTTGPDESVSGTDLGGGQVVRALAPLEKMATAIDRQTTILSNIHSALLGGTGVQSPQQQSATLGMVRTANVPGSPNPMLITDQGQAGYGAAFTAGQTSSASLRGSPYPYGGGPLPGVPTPSSQPSVGGQPAPPAGGGAPAAPTSGPSAGSTSTSPSGGAPAPTPGPSQGGTPPSPPSGGGSGGSGGSGGRGGPPAGGTSTGTGTINPNEGGGQGLLGRGYGWAASKVPALTIPNSIRNEVQSQINKNNWYRRLGGADSHMEAFGSRFEEEGYKLGQLFNPFGLSGDEAEFAFKNTRAMGYSDDSERAYGGTTQKDMLGFMTGGREQYGASMESMLDYVKLIQQNSQLGAGSLESFNSQMEQLTKNAADAGVSMEQANANFKNLFVAATGTGMGAGAQGWAFSAAETTTQRGPSMSHLTEERTQTDQAYRYMTAASMGVTVAQMGAMEKSSDGLMQVQQAESGQFVERMSSYISGSGGDLGWLQQQVQERAEALQSDPDGTAMSIAQDFWTSHFGALDPVAFLEQANTFSTSNHFTSEEEAMAFLVQEMSGQGMHAQTAKTVAKIGQFDTKTGKEKSTGLRGNAGGFQKLDKADSGFLGTLGDVFGGGEAGAATETYVNQAKKSGMASGLIGTMLNKMGEDEENDARVEVESAEGKKVVTLAQAVKWFPGQLASGQAKMVGGENAGKTIADLTGQTADTSSGTTKMASKERKREGIGQDTEEFYKDHPDMAPGDESAYKGARATIELGPKAAKFFEITGYEDADAAGEPRSNTNLYGRPTSVGDAMGGLG